ncbi:hypothetical protein POPTR_007G097650v4 [Populus trichocarpa]|uniref:Uncharacterized protein n=1 Tax=Populus trichocarpa TaxID=3694 RepID=A0ACC0SRB7_POPTR|nr:hypothetical protein POPTR_007G097650v4 [Populus trichocarpa]
MLFFEIFCCQGILWLELGSIQQRFQGIYVLVNLNVNLLFKIKISDFLIIMFHSVDKL